MHPAVLIIWALFAAVVMSPVGYVAARAVRRLRVRRRMQAALPAGELDVSHLSPTLGALALQTREVRSSLAKPLLAAEDYLAALPILDVAVSLSRHLRARRSWGMRMRATYDDAVGAGYNQVARWCERIEQIDERTREVLDDLGLSATPVRRILAEGRGLTARGGALAWVDAHRGSPEEVTQMRGQVNRVLEELDRFERVLVGLRRDPYR